MTQIAFIQPAAPQTPPPSPPSQDFKEPFSPHLEKAMTDQKETPKASAGGSQTDNTKEITKENLVSDTDKKPAENGGSSTAVEINTAANQHVDNTDKKPLEAVTDENKTQPINLGDNLMVPAFIYQLFSNALAASLTADATNQDNDSGKAQPFLPAAGSEKTPNILVTESFSLSAKSPILSTPQNDSVSIAAPQTTTKPVMNPLLLQLQQLIENSDEMGTVLIKQTGNSAASISKGQPVIANSTGANNQTPASQLDNLTAFTKNSFAQESIPQVSITSNPTEFSENGKIETLPNSIQLPIEKGVDQMPSLRQNAKEQYYEAKLGLEKGGQHESTPQDNTEDNSLSQQTQANAGTKLTSAVETEQPNTFAQPLASAQEGQKPQAGTMNQTVTLPSGTAVRQEEIIRQISEQLQIARRPDNTQVTIKLHPAELGEMKINLSMKDGNIRAHVVAQSQHVQEIMEKNMPKLKTILENQGFNVDEVTFASVADEVGDFNLFDRQLFSQNDYTPPSPKNHRPANTLFNLVHPEAFAPADTTGVNLKI